MKLRTVTFDWKPGDSWTLYPWGDWHRGHANCHTKLLMRKRDEIVRDPKGLVVLMGDLYDCITSSDKRFDSASIDYSVIEPKKLSFLHDELTKDACRMLEPIIDKVLIVHDGNHEEVLNRNSTSSLLAGVLDKLGGEELVGRLYAPGHAMTTLRFEDGNKHNLTCKIQSFHGTQASQYMGTLVNSMAKKTQQYHDADIILRGHSHHAFAVKAARLDENGEELFDCEVVLCHTGSALKTYEKDKESYAEKKDYAPIVLGFPRIIITPTRNGLKLEGIS